MTKQKIVTNGFVTSPYANKIMEIVNEELRKKTKKIEILEMVKKIDPSVPGIDAFYTFCRHLEYEQNKRAHGLIESIKEMKISDEDLLNNATQKLFGMGNIVIDETIADMKIKYIDQGKPVPIHMRKTIMDWFFKGAEAFNKSRMVEIKKAETKLGEKIVDNLLAAAQYQKLKGQDAIVVDVEAEVLNKELDLELAENNAT